jgi:hypothetical protein
MDVLTFGGDGPACIHARVLVGFASRHVYPKLPQLPVSDSLQPVKRASTHTRQLEKVSRSNWGIKP